MGQVVDSVPCVSIDGPHFISVMDDLEASSVTFCTRTVQDLGHYRLPSW